MHATAAAARPTGTGGWSGLAPASPSEHSACGNPPVEAALGIAQLSTAIPPPRAAVDCALASTGNARKFCK